ncbi:MAG TPA: 2-oxoglutarate dehydrogenase complex dihydrolipoyllysine-residue succinyltransferase, partial [Bacteroidales bacterium]|nr:2-oxoglutarate dehydrogenase complex dihydrolipoyllysine-residue succinyltransferase [Bacteroidales bacterium]
MIIEIKAPTPGESITEVQIANWLVKNGDYVAKDTEIAEIDSDKATLTVTAEAAGTVAILVEAGETVSVGTVIARIDSSADAPAMQQAEVKEKSEPVKPEPATVQLETPKTTDEPGIKITPLARKIMEEKQLTGREVLEQLGHPRITRQDVLNASEGKTAEAPLYQPQAITNSRGQERKKLSTLRIKLAERLVSVKNETAMLTTFNEVNMSAILNLKKQHNEKFKEQFGVGIGFMSFFTKAVTIALAKFPQVNAMIDGDELVFHKYADIGIAVSAPKGLVVPVIRNAESLPLAAIELKIKELAGKARDNKITLDEMTGGTFTITNGGFFGSMMSTPILNPPQSAILGMHNIIERPIAVNGQVVVAPMMYIALSYDHRVIDGRESVSFLVMVKDLLENPVKMLFEGNEPVKV